MSQDEGIMQAFDWIDAEVGRYRQKQSDQARADAETRESLRRLERRGN